MQRREFGGLAVSGFAVVASTSLSGMASAQAVSGASVAKQDEYLFWLSERDRQAAREVAASIVRELDSLPLDNRRVIGVYQRGSNALHKKTSETAFVNRVLKARGVLGASRERAFQGVEGGFRFLPSVPDGQYVIVTFDVIFGSSGILYTEQVTLSLDSGRGNQWQFIDYYLAPKPFYTYN